MVDFFKKINKVKYNNIMLDDDIIPKTMERENDEMRKKEDERKGIRV